MFPIINTINDILPYIEENDNFKINHKDDYIVVDYILNTPDMFNDPYQKECRGLIFDKDGNILSRRLHKFFNYNERPESSNVNFNQSHVILEKLDGSLITPLITQGKLTWGSMAGVTFLTPMVEEFVSTRQNYIDFSRDAISFGWTPIFEFCSRKNRIVIDHPNDRLVLIALRDNVMGTYASYGMLKDIAKLFFIDVVEEYVGNIENMQQLADQVKDMKGIEGFVVKFDNGHMSKIKADEYCIFHKAKDDLLFEKNVISILANNKADDFKQLLSPNDLEKFNEFELSFWAGVYENAEKWQTTSFLCNHKTMTRKDFALNWSEKYQYNPYQKSIIFKFFDEKEYVSKQMIKMAILDLIKKNCASQSSIDKVRELWGYKKWDYYQTYETSEAA